MAVSEAGAGMKRQPARQPALARRTQQHEQRQANAARFRQRLLDAALKKALRLAACDPARGGTLKNSGAMEV
jgi:hypothetical protein